MRIILSIVALVFVSINSNAHNPNTTSVTFTPVNGVWTVHFVVSQQGANYAIENYYTETDLSNISNNKYKELYIDYLKNHINLELNDEKILMGSGGIKLGNHQTDIRFILLDFPKNYKTVSLKLNVFEENENQNTVVRFVEGKKEFRKVLNKKNDFTLSFENTSKGFIEKQNKEKTNFWYFLIISFGVLLLILLITKKKNWW